MNDNVKREIESELADHGYRGVFVVSGAGVVTLDAALPATDEALAALEAAFAEQPEAAEAPMAEEALAS